MRQILFKIKSFLKLIRWFHELLAIFPFVTLYFIISYAAEEAGIQESVIGFQFFMLCIGVVSLMICGFILNDIVDRDIDKINKPQTHLIGRVFSLQTSWRLFWLFTVITAIVSFYISITFFWEWMFIAPIVYLFSLAYDYFLKQSPLLGNVTIALMGGCIPIVLLFFTKDILAELDQEKLYVLIYSYAFLPFVFTIPRELSLDISDMEGDLANGCKTLPIVIGVKKTRYIVFIMILSIIFASLIVLYYFPFLMPVFIFMDVLLIVYLLWFIKLDSRFSYIKAGRLLWGNLICTLIGLTIICAS